MRDAEDAVYRTLSRALLGGRLAPGTPLRESALAEVFGLSRERMRKILQRLGTNRLIELVPNRGAFVATPSLAQARDIYEARRILESGIVSHLAPTLDAAACALLRQHLQEESRALEAGDRGESVRLSAHFHMLLAEATGNHFVVQQMQELVSRTSMLVAVHESGNAMQCACAEHCDIFDTLLKGDGEGAARAMRAHLSLIETRLKPRASSTALDAVALLRGLWAESTAAAE
ncbi:FCD domain-containing protein [Xylophilus rhododendri]|uniref:FCD domain-containing protein n=1 Tax=Xylophilus rhododendri TaxID=2697032 RepID=A0A857J3V1_9BURK|nr:GntR family transcriptional regulator [Xylophilus rhododendri]QHI97809.1 FCD domain-containing protein [Xylophilus rhododendri]